MLENYVGMGGWGWVRMLQRKLCGLRVLDGYPIRKSQWAHCSDEAV
jgi:hypothetical protein